MRKMTEKDAQTMNARLGSGDFLPGTLMLQLQELVLAIADRVADAEEDE